MNLLGYSDRLSVAPGEVIRFMVHCEADTYKASLVRLFHGTPQRGGPGLKKVDVPSDVEGDYSGEQQVLPQGSAVIIADQTPFPALTACSLSCWINPTAPGKGIQAILTKWLDSIVTGFGLFITEEGLLELRLQNGESHSLSLTTSEPLQPRTWYLVGGAFDEVTGKVLIYQGMHDPRQRAPALAAQGDWPRGTFTGGDVARRAPIVIAAYAKGWSGDRLVTDGHFNGKVEAPAVFRRALSHDDFDSLAEGADPCASEFDALAVWDFTPTDALSWVPDRAGSGMDGHMVNFPTRGVTGRTWTGKELSFLHAPTEYAAIHFHDDDLEDARWEPAAELRVSTDFPSGVYAFYIRTDRDEDYIPFFVRPARGHATAPIAFLAPTFSYLAYANEHVEWTMPEIAALTGRADLEKEVGERDRFVARAKLLSLYDYHRDGSGNCFASRLRPLVTMRPDYHMPMLRSPHQLSADLCLIDWLHQRGYAHDVLTDEDLHNEGLALLESYRVVLTGSHPEYVTERMLDTLEQYVGAGGRLMYLGGNGFYWVTGISTEYPHVIEVRRGHAGTRPWEALPGETAMISTGEPGGLWRHRGRAPQRLVGVGMAAQGFDRSSPYRRCKESWNPRAAFIFDGVDDELIGDFGLIMGGAAGHEIDHVDPVLGTPGHALIVASSENHSDSYQGVVEEMLVTDMAQGGTANPAVRADMVFFETSGGGAVFSTGSVAWCGGLSYNQYENNVSRITENVLARFLDERPFGYM